MSPRSPRLNTDSTLLHASFRWRTTLTMLTLFFSFDVAVDGGDLNIKVDGNVAALALSSDGKHLAVASRSTSGADTNLALWDLSASKGINVPLGQRQGFYGPYVIFSPDQKSVLFCSDTGIQSIDRASGAPGANLPNEILLRAVNGWMLTYRKKIAPELNIYDVDTLHLVHSIKCPPTVRTTDSWSGNLFDIAEDLSAIAYAYESTIQVIDFPSKKERQQLIVTAPVEGVALSSDGKRLVTVGKNKFLPVFEWKDVDQPPIQLAIPDGYTKLATASVYPIRALSFLGSDFVCLSSSGGTSGLWSISQKKFVDVAPTSGTEFRARVTIPGEYCTVNNMAMRVGADQKLEVLTDIHRNMKDFNSQPYGKVPFLHSKDGRLLAFAISNSMVAVRSTQNSNETPSRIASGQYNMEIAEKGVVELPGRLQFVFSDDSKVVGVGSDRGVRLQALYEVATGNKLGAELPTVMREGGYNSRNEFVKGPNVHSAPGIISASYFDDSKKELCLFGRMDWVGVRPKALSPYQSLMYTQPIWFRIPIEGGLARVETLKPSKAIWLRVQGDSSGAFKLKDGTRALVLETKLSTENFRTLTGNSQLALFNLETGETIRVLTQELKQPGFTRQLPGGVGALLVSPDGTTLVVPMGERRVRIWNLETGDEVENDVDYHPGDGQLAFSGNGRFLCVTKGNQPIVIYELKTKQSINLVAVSEDGYESVVEVCPTHPRYLSQTLNGMLAWRSLLDGKLISRPSSHKSNVISGGFSNDGSVLATLSADRELRFWRVPTPSDEKGAGVVTLGPLVSFTSK